MHKELYKKYCGMSADSIRADLLSEASVNSEYAASDNVSHKLCDTASLFVAAAYLSDKGNTDKDILRKNAYLAFLGGDRSAFPEAWALIGLLTKNIPCDTGLNIRILKGGSYKIKNYYLENYLLKDIRGASVLLTYVEEQVIPSMISDRYIPECIVYCGGGNIFAIVPEDCSEAFALELEAAAGKLLVSADAAYYISDVMPFSDIMGSNYRQKMTGIENHLNERKKLIINCSAESRSDYIGSSIEFGEGLNAPVNAKEIAEGGICSACGKRKAFYLSGNDKLCAACMHKRCVGAEAKRTKYTGLYEKYCLKTPKTVNSLADIADKDGYISIVYGDGNNMGGIIGRFEKITQMMAFSRDVKTITEKAAFEAMGEHGIDRFEVVGLGGDDIFVIVSGNKAVRFTVSLIEKYNRQFEKYRSEDTVSTLSAGIAIAKQRMPVQVILEKAEDELKRAKDIAKQKQDNCGSLSFVIMDAFESQNTASGADNDITPTLLPYYTDAAKEIIAFAKDIRDRKMKTRLRNILDAFTSAESSEEAELFLNYTNAKEKQNNKKIKLPDINGYEKTDGYYIRNGKKYYIWSDVIQLLDYIE